MKTAMQELIDFLEPQIKMHDFLQLPAYEKALSLLEKEKEQIYEAFVDGDNRGDNEIPFNCEQYYNQKYNNEKL